MNNGKCVNPDPPTTIFKLDRMVEKHPDDKDDDHHHHHEYDDHHHPSFNDNFATN